MAQQHHTNTARPHRPHRRPRRHRQPTAVPAARVAAMQLAVELEVDGEEFGLRGQAEAALWAELVAEFEDRVAREGRSWVPELLG
ncbi:MAG: hypothetical protein AAFN30_19320 [Actinomycetota bacterium]